MTEALDRITHSEQKTEGSQPNPLQCEALAELSSRSCNSVSRNNEMQASLSAGSEAKTSARSTGVDAKDSLNMNSIFTADNGVTQAQLQHAEDIVNALPDQMKQTLLDAGVSVELSQGWQRGTAQGENDATQAMVYVDSGMMDQALVHELYEMAGQVSPNTLKGFWNDADAVSIADNDTSNILNGQGKDPGDLNDTLSRVQFNNGFQDSQTVHGDGDLMSNAFAADFYATHPSLYTDTVGAATLTSSVQDAPDLVDYIAQAQGLNSAARSSSLPFANGNVGSRAAGSPPIPIIL